MKGLPVHWFAFLVLACMALPHTGVAQQPKNAASRDPLIYQYFNRLRADMLWKLVDSIPLGFATYHTQGLARVGNFYFLSAVKVNRWPKKYPAIQNGYDRDQGEGVGYLFKFNDDGKLVDSIRLGKDEIYHPGGIDFDGTHIWVPVCEYRPHGKSIIYRVLPETLQSSAVATLPDAIGAVAYNRQTHELVGMNWGSRTFYTWSISPKNNIIKAALVKGRGDVNPHFYVDFQDCVYAGAGKMICSGLRAYNNAKGETIRLGGLEVIDMNDYEAGLQLPVSEYTSNGAIITNNPFYTEVVNGVLQLYFIPEDDASTLYIYQLQ